MIWDFFQRRVCLTNDEAEWELAAQEFHRVGLDGVEKFPALPDIGPHQSFNRSIRQILTEFYQSGAQTLLHLEDDCVFRDTSHLANALSELPDQWQIVYLGANVQGIPKRVAPHLFQLTDAWTTHAIGFQRKVIPYILANQPGFSDTMFDNFLGSKLRELNAYVVAPMIAWQRPRYSAIWKEPVNYDEIFEESERKLA